MKRVALSEAKDRLSKYLHDAEREDVVIMRHGKPAGVLIGFASEDDWFDYRLESDPRFAARIAAARDGIRSGSGTRLEDLGHPPRRPNKRLQQTAAGRGGRDRGPRRRGR